MLINHNLKITVDYSDFDDVSVSVTFTDIDGRPIEVYLSSLNEKMNIDWFNPRNNSLENIELYSEAIRMIVEAGKVIKSGKRLEDVWGSEVEVITSQVEQGDL